MSDRAIDARPQGLARIAGVLYLIIIVFGISSEVFIRSALVVKGDPAATATRIAGSQELFHVGFLADTVMVVCDIALAVLFYVLLKPVNRTVALVAMCFRLCQAGVLALNLLNYHAAILILTGAANGFDPGEIQSLTYLFLELHGHGYDLGLILFGVHCLLLGYLIVRSGYLPRLIGGLTVAAGMVYLIGSYTRFLAPNYVDAVQPVYAIAVIAEVTLCLWLLLKGVNTTVWMKRAGFALGSLAVVALLSGPVAACTTCCVDTSDGFRGLTQFFESFGCAQ